MSVTAVPIRPLPRGSVLKLWIGLIVLMLIAAAIAWFGTAGQQRIRTATGLQYQVIEEGEGEAITPADLALIHFIARREDGEVFADTRRGEPIPAAVGNFVPGFDEALQLMRQGSHFRIWIPPELGYGDTPPPGAPFEAGETLVFDIQVLQVAPGMAAMQSLMGGPGGPGGPSGGGPGGPGGPGEGAPPGGAEPQAPPPGNSSAGNSQ